MVPAILTRVLGREDKQFRFQDAILLVCGVSSGYAS